MRSTSPAIVAVLAVATVACGSDPAPMAAPTATTAPTRAESSAPTETSPQEASGTASVAFGDLDLAGDVTSCGFDPDLEAPEDGSPLTVLTVLATATGPEGDTWNLQFVRTLSGSSIIDVVNVHLDEPLIVDRYEAQRVVDADADEVTDHWGDSTNALFVHEISDGQLTLAPPDEVTFGVFPTEGDAHVAGVGTFAVTCTLT